MSGILDCQKCKQKLAYFKHIENVCYCDKVHPVPNDSGCLSVSKVKDSKDSQTLAVEKKKLATIKKRTAKKSESQYQRLLKDYIFSAPVPEKIKNFIYVFVYHNLRSKKAFKVYSDNLITGDGIGSRQVYVDTESDGVFCALSGKYIGYSKNGKLYVL
jgi:hypothetical protein